MVNDAALRSSLLCLAVVMVMVGFYTHSFKKTVATYIFGMFAIGGVILPDWDFFDRNIALWCTSLTVDSVRSPSTPTRFRMFPIRLAIYTLLYAYAFYKWWMLVST